MKISIAKIVFLVPLLLFLDMVLLVVLGNLSNIFGADDHFFCTIYCYFGIALLISSFLFMLYVVGKPFHKFHPRFHA